MGVGQLGYLVLDVSEINAWRDLAANIIGAEARSDEGTGAKGSAMNTNSSITSPSKTRSTTIIARLELMLTSSERFST